MKLKLLKFSELMEAPYLMSNYDKEDHQIKDGDYHATVGGGSEYKHISTMKSGHEIVKVGDGSKKYGGPARYMAVDHMHKIHMKVDGHHDHETGTFRVSNLTGHQKSEVKAHDFYHHLLNHFKLQSDSTHSTGSFKVWHRLSQMDGVKMSHHSGNGEKLKLNKKDWSQNYRKEGDGDDRRVYSNSRFIASKPKKRLKPMSSFKIEKE